MQNNRTKIVCTLGPATDTVDKIVELIEAGMDVARINFSHGTHASNLKLINSIRKAETKTGKCIGILQDLQGPKIRIGEMPEKGIRLKKDQNFILTTRKVKGKETKTQITIPTLYNKLHKDLKAQDIVLIDDGQIECKVLKIKGKDIHCQAVEGGTVTTRRGINLPTASVSQPAITAKDKKDLKFGIKHGVDFIALSFVKSDKDIRDLRKLITKQKGTAQIIAKIERHEAVKKLCPIIEEADAVMVARGDLACDITPERVPIIQKRIIKYANKMGKPVITATQVLQSMVKNPVPTRAEVSDAANAIFDHTDAIMLSNESATGKYPVKAVEVLNRVAITAEKELQKNKELLNFDSLENTCKKACMLAMRKDAQHLIIFCNRGKTVGEISKHRPQIHLIAITEQEKLARQFSLNWGFNDIFVQKFSSLFFTRSLRKFLLEHNLARKGETAIYLRKQKVKKFTI